MTRTSPTRLTPVLLAAFAGVGVAALLLPHDRPLEAAAVTSGTADRCVASSAAADQPAAMLARARAVTGYDAMQGRVLQYSAIDTWQDYIQSDRPYPPYHAISRTREIVFDPASGAERSAEHATGTMNGPGRDAVWLATERAVWGLRDSVLQPAAFWYESSLLSRPLSVHAVLHDWSVAPDVRLVGRCDYREFPRVVLARRGAVGEERLYLDPKSGFPVKLDRDEPHYLWGQQHVEYQYVTWYDGGVMPVPMSAVRITDGEIHAQRALGRLRLVARDSVPLPAVPDTALRMQPQVAQFLQPLPPDTVRVAPDLFLLRNRGYTQAVALVHDTVFVLDATQGEARARQDSAWIGRLFPGRHPVVLVVTDLAWPHVAGARYWVANGAPVISHRMSRTFIQRVMDRRWAAPDLYERVRARRPLRFVGIDGPRAFAGGAVQVAPIDGIGSEGAILVYFPAQRFLWASDFVQDTRSPSLYVSEVVAAARRAGFTPERVGAQHIPIVTWAALEALAAQRP